MRKPPKERPEERVDEHDGVDVPPRASELLDHLLDRHSHHEVTLGRLVEVLGDRAFGALLLVFALPNLIPVPLPGLSTVLGIPMILFSVQLMLGRSKPWLPKRLAAVTLPRSTVETLSRRTRHRLEQLERMLRPRLCFLAEGPAERMIGLYILLISLVLCLPIPLGNWLPAFAVCLMSLGIIEKDGVLVGIGGAVGIASLAVVASVVGVAWAAALAVLREFGLAI
ncbi:exopolysaccharide biosynthesis protein [Arenibaculum pallidiluteum]|uniref:exopolysaccharide biosynthesis protein n=1 Tax=Arenibaculum pallidiluteum TaxID=2812559 RepID=UPI001A974106|nr:exopolysaccharide biosynthesis protein [Arenibaculum pallidiluteum]